MLRINLSWFWTEEELDYVVEALELVARQGWKLLPRYRFNNETGERETGTDRPTD